MFKKRGSWLMFAPMPGDPVMEIDYEADLDEEEPITKLVDLVSELSVSALLYYTQSGDISVEEAIQAEIRGKNRVGAIKGLEKLRNK